MDSTRDEKFPHSPPLYKSPAFSDVIFTMGVYGEILYPLSDLNEIWYHWVLLKSSNDRGEFDLDQAKSKNNIAENLVALGHETHNKYQRVC